MEDVLLVVLRWFSYVLSLFSSVDILSASPWGLAKKEELAVASEQEEWGRAGNPLAGSMGRLARGWVSG